MRVLLSKSAYVKYITRRIKLRNKTRPFIVGSEFSFCFLEIFVQRPISKYNHIHLLFLTQIIPQSPSHKHFLFPRQSPSVEQVLPQNPTLFVLGQPLEPMKTRKSIKNCKDPRVCSERIFTTRLWVALNDWITAN